MKSREFIREAIRNGWKFLRQGKGSHEIYEKMVSRWLFQITGQKKLEKDWNRN